MCTILPSVPLSQAFLGPDWVFLLAKHAGGSSEYCRAFPRDAGHPWCAWWTLKVAGAGSFSRDVVSEPRMPEQDVDEEKIGSKYPPGEEFRGESSVMFPRSS